MFFNLFKKKERLRTAAEKRNESRSFCVIPWKGMLITDSGVVKICCQSEWLSDAESRPLNIYQDRLAEIWNSDNMRKVRREMVEGRFPRECKTCHRIEAEGGNSRRMQENHSWKHGWVFMDGVDFNDLISMAVDNQYRLPYRPMEYELEAGNLCNLQCRSCSTERSSKVEMDPVQSQWSGKHHDTLRWKNNRAVIGPHTIIGGRYEGFIGYDPRFKVRWTKGRAKLALPVAVDEIDTIGIRFAEPVPDGHEVCIYVNGNLIYRGCPATEGMSLTRNLTDDCRGETLELGFESPRFRLPDSGRKIGIGIEHMEITRRREKTRRRGSQALSSRLSNARHWLKEKDFIYNELLKEPKEIRHLRIVGGEPLIIQEIIEITDYIVQKGEPEKFVLGMSTNGMIFDRNFFENSRKLKALALGVSLDGTGDLCDYIRYPADWERITKNIDRYLEYVEKKHFYISITVMAYNVLDLVDLLRFCDRNDYSMYIFMLNYPDYLSIEILPPKARMVAAERLRKYVETDCRDRFKDAVMSIVYRLEGQGETFNRDKLRTFMLFTNDLDRARGQKIEDVCGELVKFIEDAGVPWTNETRFAGEAPATRAGIPGADVAPRA